jgi:hypothetical protein
MDWTCAWGWEVCKNLSKNLKLKDHLIDQGVDETMELGDTECWGVNWNPLPKDKAQWRALVDRVMNLWVPWSAWNFLTSWVSIIRATWHQFSISHERHCLAHDKVTGFIIRVIIRNYLGFKSRCLNWICHEGFENSKRRFLFCILSNVGWFGGNHLSLLRDCGPYVITFTNACCCYYSCHGNVVKGRL